ncbi:hypothetical protein, partial [Thalassospira sp. MIT1004]|uniref:hypothetical protein n=1 Tax=Thalassospira sp. MIT1004 TaxID=1882733 RepID=UPI001B3577F0
PQPRRRPIPYPRDNPAHGNRFCPCHAKSSLPVCKMMLPLQRGAGGFVSVGIDFDRKTNTV